MCFLQVCWTQHYLLFAVPEATGNAFGSPGQSVYEEQHTSWKSWRAAKSIKQGLGAHWQDLGLQQALWDPDWSKLSSEHGDRAASAWFFSSRTSLKNQNWSWAMQRPPQLPLFPAQKTGKMFWELARLSSWGSSRTYRQALWSLAVKRCCIAITVRPSCSTVTTKAQEQWKASQ